jgi:hypothetical protein
MQGVEHAGEHQASEHGLQLFSSGEIIVAARYLDYSREMAAAATTGLPPPEVIAKVMGRYGVQPVKQ